MNYDNWCDVCDEIEARLRAEDECIFCDVRGEELGVHTLYELAKLDAKRSFWREIRELVFDVYREEQEREERQQLAACQGSAGEGKE
jgi:hypothetical protein